MKRDEMMTMLPFTLHYLLVFKHKLSILWAQLPDQYQKKHDRLRNSLPDGGIHIVHWQDRDVQLTMSPTVKGAATTENTGQAQSTFKFSWDHFDVIYGNYSSRTQTFKLIHFPVHSLCRVGFFSPRQGLNLPHYLIFREIKDNCECVCACAASDKINSITNLKNMRLLAIQMMQKLIHNRKKYSH